MKRLSLVLLLALGGCVGDYSEPLLVAPKMIVADVPDGYFKCLQTSYPDYRTLTDRQVALLLVQMHRNNVQCRANMQAIHDAIEAAKKAAE